LASQRHFADPMQTMGKWEAALTRVCKSGSPTNSTQSSTITSKIGGSEKQLAMSN